MLYIFAIIAGVLAGVISGGRLTALSGLKFKKGWIILAAFALQTAAQIFASALTVNMDGLNLFLTAQAASYLLLLAGIWLNRHYLGIIAAGAGCVLNGLVIILNGGKMPVDASLAPGIAMDARHSVIHPGTRLSFLSDIFSPPGLLGQWMRVVSAGDLLIAMGLMILFFEIIYKDKIYSGGKKSV